MKKIDTKSATKASKATSKKSVEAPFRLDEIMDRSTQRALCSVMDTLFTVKGKSAGTKKANQVVSPVKGAVATCEPCDDGRNCLRFYGNDGKEVNHFFVDTAGSETGPKLMECVKNLVNESVSKRVFVPEGMKAVFIPAKAYRHLEQMADTMNQDKWAGQDNTAQGVFANLVLDRDLEDDPANLMDGILESLDYLPEVAHDKRTPQDEKTIARRKAALTRRAASIKWA